MADVSVTIEINGYEDAGRLAVAVALLRRYALLHGDKEARHLADEASEALRNLSFDTKQRL
jgi:hypothetical protein